MSTSRLLGSTIEIKAPNAGSDWQLSDLSSKPDISKLRPGVPIKHMLYTPGASRDVVVVKDQNDAGTQIAKFECGSCTDQKILYLYGARKRPYIDISAGTHGKKTISVLHIELD